MDYPEIIVVDIDKKKHISKWSICIC